MEFDFCPYCDHEIKVSDVFEMSEITGNETAELVECPNCGKMLRANLEPKISITLYAEEDYLDDCEALKTRYEQELNTEFGQDNKDFYEYKLDQITDEIKQVNDNIKYNDKVLGDFNDL